MWSVFHIPRTLFTLYMICFLYVNADHRIIGSAFTLYVFCYHIPCCLLFTYQWDSFHILYDLFNVICFFLCGLFFTFQKLCMGSVFFVYDLHSHYMCYIITFFSHIDGISHFRIFFTFQTLFTFYVICLSLSAHAINCLFQIQELMFSHFIEFFHIFFKSIHIYEHFLAHFQMYRLIY